MAKCLCGCDRTVKNRGLCSQTYQRYNRDIKARRTTWSWLIASGMTSAKKKNPYGGNHGMVKEVLEPIKLDEEL